jgi:putative ABC transport system substrate-binding protein
MKRREFITLFGGVTAAWPLAARAQQAGKVPTIGVLGTDPSSWTPWTTALVAGLRELGWIEGRNIAIEYRWDDGRLDRVAELAAEFVRLEVDVIVTYGTAVPIVKRATSVIPIIFAVASDPVGGGLVASLARPGGNATGISQQLADIASKRIELLHEVVPGLRRLAVIVDTDNPQTAPEMAEVQARLAHSASK